MKITYLLETAAELWGGVKTALHGANLLADRGHDVTIVSRSGPPDWMELRVPLETVPQFSPVRIPESDLIVGTFWTTVPHAIACQRGVPVHFCQGYEGDNPEFAAHRARIEEVYRLPAHKVTITPRLAEELRTRTGQPVRQVVYGIDHTGLGPAEPPRPDDARPTRIGLVGPYQVPWKDIATGLEACGLASRAGLELQLVRITNTSPHPDEENLPFPVEWHVQVPPAAMGDLYRSLDVFLGSSSGAEEGFFMPAIEAMACGVPCVLTDIPAFRGYTEEGNHALFAPPKDPMALAEALVMAARHPQVRDNLRGQSLATASRYTYENHVDELERAFEEILAEARPGGTQVPAVGTAAGPAAYETGPRPLTALPRLDAAPAPTGDASGSGRGVVPADFQLPPSPTGPAPAPTPPALAGNGMQAASSGAPTGEQHLDGLTSAIADALLGAADLYLAGQRYEEAAEHLGAASRIRSDDLDVMQRHAHALYLAGQDEAALHRYEELLQRGFDTAELQVNRGMILFGRGQNEAALAAFDRALQLGQRDAELLNNLGVVRHAIGDAVGARAAFEEALQLDPAHEDARVNLEQISQG